MPVPDPKDLGPLAALIGTWEGGDGVDVAFHNDDGHIEDTPYRERITFSPFGPVDNGSQCLYGLDYRMAAWRGDEEDPFHTEVGYWLWDAGRGLVMRSFMVPRGQTLIAGGTCAADATEFTLTAERGSTCFGILSNPYLEEAATTASYSVTVTIEGEDAFSYAETTVIHHARLDGKAYDHTDRNRLRRVSAT